MGAAAFQPRKLAVYQSQVDGFYYASMGPRPFSRGNPKRAETGQGRGEASMGPRPFSRGNAEPGGLGDDGGGGFNGAAAFQPRKFAPLSARLRYLLWLQWGRGLSAAEIAGPALPGAPGLSRFNGAAAFQPRKCGGGGLAAWHYHLLQWGRGLSAAEIRSVETAIQPQQTASMGPRPFSRGNDPRKASIFNAQCSLQWGRGLSAAEMCRSRSPARRRRRCFNGAAAFQPRKSGSREQEGKDDGCVNGAAAFQPRKWAYAAGALASIDRLQWGRGLSAAEMAAAIFQKLHLSARLQWGRGLSAAEIGMEACHFPDRNTGFNGAAAFNPRKCAGGAALVRAGSCFNGAAAFQPRKSQCHTTPLTAIGVVAA